MTPQLDLLRRSRIYVACQSQDDLPYILQFGTEDNLMVGTDYTHADQSAELLALDIVEQRGASGEIPAEVVRKQAAGPNSAIDFGIDPRCVRLHVGLEGADVLWSDLAGAIDFAARSQN